MRYLQGATGRPNWTDTYAPTARPIPLSAALLHPHQPG